MQNLKYLFTTEFTDGTTYKQNKQDCSIDNPPVIDENGIPQGKNCYSDIAQRVEKYQLKKFHLIEQKILAGNIYTVDLTDGHFEINGIPFTTESDKPLPVQPQLFKLVYYIIKRQQFITPARFINPLQYVKSKDTKGMSVIDSKGLLHTFPKIDTYWTGILTTDPIEGEERKPILDADGKEQKCLYVLPSKEEQKPRYALGWQATIANKNYQQTILIS